MPPEPTTRSKKRVPRKYTEEELKDIEVKRLKGELSCAECRRLKLKCDKKVPCGSCVRRGCESICPCGVLSAGQGTRFILASTDQLHSKINNMSHRIRQLEDALAILQATISDQRHPLLEDELLRIKFGSEVIPGSGAGGGGGSGRYESPEDGDEHEDGGEGLGRGGRQGGGGGLSASIDALGTLTLGDSGEVKYFGRSAGSETLMMAEDDDSEEEEEEGEGDRNTSDHPPSVEPILSSLGLHINLSGSGLFPFSDVETSSPEKAKEVMRILKSYLPSKERARSLCESYLVHASNFFRPIKREELLEVYLPLVYPSPSSLTPSSSSNLEDSSPISDKELSPHTLATLFFIFALGALLDLSLPAYNSEAERFYSLARASLSLRVVFDSPQVDTVIALGLMATYHTLAGRRYSRDSAWCVMSIAAKLAQCIGLHRDSARWHMDPKMVQKRRTLFWEIYAADMSHSLAIGRPPAIHLSYVDCEFPTDEEASLSDSGEVQHGFWRMKYIFARDMFLGVADTTLTAKSLHLNYSSALELDRKVREFSFPSSVQPYARKEEVGEEVYHSSEKSLQGFYASQYRTVTMLYLHRSFFAQALLDHPQNPLLSPFAPSFLTAYRCASVIIKAGAHQFDRCAEMAKRVWFLLYHMFSAAIIVGTVVTRSPNSNIAANALEDLQRAIELFEQTAPVSHRAKVALGVLRKLQDKALRSYKQYKSRSNSTSKDGVSTSTPQSNAATSTQLSNSNAATDASGSSTTTAGDVPTLIPKTEDLSDELAIFGGQTRVLAKKKTRRQKSVGSMSMVMDSPSPPISATNSVSPPPQRPQQMKASVSGESTGSSATASDIGGAGAGAGAGNFGGTTGQGFKDPFSPGAFPGSYSALGVASPPPGAPSTLGRASQDTVASSSTSFTLPTSIPSVHQNSVLNSDLDAYTTPLPEQSQLDSFYPNLAGGPMPPSIPAQQPTFPSPEAFFRALDASQPVVTSQPQSFSNLAPSGTGFGTSANHLFGSENALWRPFSPDVNGLPKADTSFGWIPPPQNRGGPSPFGFGMEPQQPPQQEDDSLAAARAQKQREIQDIMERLRSAGFFSGDGAPAPPSQPTQQEVRGPPQRHPGMTFNNQSLSPLSFLTQSLGPSDSDSLSMGMDFGLVGQSTNQDLGTAGVSTGGLSTGGAGDSASMMVELGLMTESTMDSGWFNFMQDCGIVVDGSGTTGFGGSTNMDSEMGVQ